MSKSFIALCRFNSISGGHSIVYIELHFIMTDEIINDNDLIFFNASQIYVCKRI